MLMLWFLRYLGENIVLLCKPKFQMTSIDYLKNKNYWKCNIKQPGSYWGKMFKPI